MVTPSYRDLTKRFNQLRHGYKSSEFIHPTEKSASNESGKTLLLNMDNTSNMKDTPPNVGMGDAPPMWMETLTQIDVDIDKITEQIQQLKHDHSRRQRVVFEDEKSAEIDAEIQETTRSITRLFQRCKKELQLVASKGNENNQAGFEDRTVRYNVMRSRATQIQELTKTFREAQRSYLQAMKSKEQKMSRYGNDSISQTLPDLENIANGFDAEQLQRLKQIERNASDRTQEILNIAKSVHELATLFQELSVLVVEQGSLLDRIDYNVEQTLDNLTKAKKHVDKANVYQKRSRSALCIIVLIMLILVAGFILILRQLGS